MKNVSALLTTIFIVILLSIPIVIFFYSISSDATTLYVLAKQKLVTGDLFDSNGCTTGLACTINTKIEHFLSDPKIMFYVNNALGHATTFVLDYTSGIFISIPKFILKLFICFFVLFYSFRDGKEVLTWLKGMLPLKHRFKEDLFSRTQDVIFATVYGTIIVAIIQGIVATIGFIIFGVPSAILLGLLLTFAALIPLVGTALVWLPTSVIMIIDGYVHADNTIIGKGIGLLLYGALIISLIDNIIKPRIISKEAKLHPVLILIGLFGGLHVLGPIGMVIGPLVFALLVSFIHIYQRDKHEISS